MDYPNNVLPEIDWENPLNDGLVGLFYFDGTNVVDLVSGAIGTGTPTASGDGWVGDAVFTLADLAFNLDVGRALSFQAFGEFTASSAGGGTGTFIEFLSGSADYLSLSGDINYSGTKPKLNGAYSVHTAGSGLAEGTALDTIGVELTNRNGVEYFDSRIYCDNTLTAESFARTSTTTPMLTMTLGEATSPLNYVAVYDRERTLQEYDEVNANPYQLLKSSPDTEQEYGINTSAGQMVQTVTTSNKSSNYILEVEFTLLAPSSSVNLVRGSSGGVGDLYIDYNQAVRFNSGWAAGLVAADTGDNLRTTLNKRQQVRIVCVGGAVTAYVNGTPKTETITVPSSHGFRFPNESFEAASGGIIQGHYVKYICSDFPQDSRIWDFNQTKGTTVTDHLNEAIATLVGFPTQSGYIRADTGVALVGYLFAGSTTALIRLVGAYTGTVTYVDDTTLAISGTGNYIVNSSHIKAIKSINVTDTVANYIYDGTAGDESKLININGSNHAVISNDSTVGFQPIEPVEVYTIGSNKDYTFLRDFTAAVKARTGVVRGVIYERDEDNTAIYLNSSNLTRMELIAHPSVYWKGQGDNAVGIPNAGLYCYGVDMDIRGIGGIFRVGTKLSMKDCNAKVTYHTGFDVGAWHIQDSYCPSITTIAHTIYVTNVITSDRIVCGIGSVPVIAHIDGLISTSAGEAFLGENTPSYASAGAKTYVKNSQFAFGNLNGITDLGGNEVGVDMTTTPWFTDAPNKDYSLTTEGQQQTQGKGWNGSNIAEWAYAEPVGQTPINKTITIGWSKTANASINKTITIGWSKTANASINKTITIGWSKNATTFITKPISVSWSKFVAVMKSISSSWSKNATTFITKPINVSWSKYEFITKPINVSWSKYEFITKPINVSWSKDATSFIHKPLTVSWSKYKSITQPINVSWTKLGAGLVKTLNVSWTKLQFITKPINVSWSKDATTFISTSITMSWSKYEAIDKTINISWSKYKEIYAPINISWSKYRNISKSVNHTWSKDAQYPVSTNLPVSWSKYKHVTSVPLTASWSKTPGINSVSKTLTVSWTKYRNFNTNVSIRWSKSNDRIAPLTRTVEISHQLRQTTISYADRTIIIKG